VVSNIIYNENAAPVWYYPYYMYVSTGYADLTDNVIGHPTDTHNIRFDNHSGATLYMYYMFHSAPTNIKRNLISGITINSNTSMGFVGFYHGTSTIGTFNIDSNTISRFFSRSLSSSTLTNAAFCGMALFNGSPSVNIRGNRIGGTNPIDSISIFSSSLSTPNSSTPASTRMIGIYSGSGIAVMNDNTVGQFYTNSNATGGLTTAAQCGIFQNSGTGGSVLSNNLVTDFTSYTLAATSQIGIASGNASLLLQGNTVRNFITNSNSTLVTTSAAINGLVISSSQQHSILNNNIFNLNAQNSAAANQINGICASVNAQNTIRGNNIYNLRSATTAASTSTSAGIIGINNFSGAMNQVIDSNSVYNLTATNNLATANPSVIGIFHQGNATVAGNTSAITRNLIYGLTYAYPATQTPTSSIMYGLQYQGGTGTVANNIIRIGRDTSGTAMARPGQYRGIFVSAPSTSQIRMYHNSVLVDLAPDFGLAGAPNPSTACLEVAGAASTPGFMDIRNNIFVNNSVNAGVSTLNHYGKIFGTSMARITTGSNLHFNSASANAFVGRFNSINYSTIQLFAAATAQGGSSGFGNPNFVAPTAATPDLRLASPNAAEGMGDTTVLAFVSNDFDGLSRSGRTPVDIGASSSATNALSSDVMPPNIYYTPLVNTSSPANRVFTATIFDGVNVPVSAALAPRVYFRKSSQSTWQSSAGTFVSAAGRSRTYSFTIDNTLMGGLSVGDSILYYLIAADSAAGNINSNPAYAVATNTSTVTTHPITLNGYLFNDPIPTTVYIGTGAGSPSYPTLSGTGGFFAAVNNSALQGNTTVLIQSNVTEPGTFELNKWLEVGAGGYQLTIRPADNNQYVLSGTSTGLRFNNIDNVKLLGFSPTGTLNDTNLIVRVSAASPALLFNNGGSSDTIINVIFETRAASTGNVQVNNNTTTRGFSNTLFSNCYFRQDLTGGTTMMAIGLNILGVSPRFNSGISVDNCKFMNFTTSGIVVGNQGNADNFRINNNHFYFNYGISTSTSLSPINFFPGATSNGNQINGNYIGGREPFAAGAAFTNSASVTFSAIWATSGTGTGTVINGNIIQNISLTSTSGTGTFTGILAQGTSAVYTINNNRIGSYTLPIFSLNNGRFQGISTSSTGNLTIQNDSILNITVVNTGTIAGITGIISQSGSANVVNISNNFLQGFYTNAANSGTTTAAALMGIVSTHSTLSLTINNNTVRTLIAANGTAASTSVRPILVTSGTPIINGNTVYGISSRSTYTGTTTLANVIGIASTTTLNGALSISNNIVDSMGWTNPTSTSAQMIGILYNSGGSQNANVSGNIIRNLISTSSNTGITTASSLVGLMVNAAFTVNANYNDNRISNLVHAVNNSSVSVAGMYLSTSTSVIGNNSNVLRNLVHSVTSASTATPVLTGIQVNNGFLTLANNMVRMGIDTAANLYTNAATIRGIWHQNTTQCFYYHNTVFMAGGPAAGAALTSAFESSALITSGQQMDIRNNIFANTISNGAATGFNFGIRLQDSLRITSNYNIIHTPGVGGIAGGIVQTNSRYALLGGDSMSWKAITGLDQASSSASPNFSAAATAVSPNVDLSLQSSNPAERSGDPTVTIVSTDYYNNSRASNTPSDIGAHAGNFTMAPDAFAPVIAYTPMSNAGSLTGIRTLTNVVITDNNGIVMSGANRPKLYYSRDGVNWFSSSALTVTGNATNAVASFNIDYLVFSPTLTLSDTIRYFVVAQDAASNLGSFPILAVGTDVNTISQYPRNPSRYSFLPVIPANTVLQVGAGQTYTSLTNAGGLFEFLNSRTLGGNIVAEITSDLTAETGAIPLNRMAEDGVGAGTFSLTIRPNASATTPRLIQGSYNNPSTFFGLITLIGADRVKISGIPTGGTASQRLLRIRNTAPTGTYGAGTGSSVITVSSATGVAIRNCIIESGNANQAGGSIEFRVGVNNQFLTTACSFDTVTNCVLTNNTIATLPDGIPANSSVYSFGAPNVYNNNIVITNNEISNMVTAGIGVVGNNGDGFVISGNSIFYNLGFVPNITGTFQGIVFLPGAFASGHTISNNFIGGTAVNCGGSAWVNPNNLGFTGIRTSVGNGANTLISGNTIRNISFTNQAATGQFTGIRAEAGNTVINGNTVGDAVVANGINWQPSASFFGIIYQGANNIQIVNNNIQGIAIPTPNTFAQFIGIYVIGGTVSAPISGNIVGHATNSNNIVFAGNTTHYGMLVSVNAFTTPSYSITNNTIANLTSTGVGTSTFLYGVMVQNSGFPTISNNTVREIKTSSISTSTTGVAIGIYSAVNTSTIANISNNLVSAIRATNTGNVPTTVHGILQTSGQDIVLNANRVWDITNASSSVSVYPAPVAAGISIGGGSTTANLYNNQVTLGNGFAGNVQLNGIMLYTSNTSLILNAINNSVLIDGAAAGAGPQNTYALLRGNNTGTEINTYMALRNNIFANRRTGGSGNHYALSNQTSTPSNTTYLNNTSMYNLLTTANTSTVAEWGLSANNIANWRTNSTSDNISYYVQAGNSAGQLNLTNLFTAPATGNLGLNTSNQEVWYVYGKGITGASANNLNSDFSGSSRSTSQGIATTIGSVHMTSAPSMLPIAAIASAAPSANTTTSYTFASRPVASISWGASAPTGATVYDFTGVNPPAAPAGNFNNRYVRTDVSGGTPPYTYGLTYNFNPANLGGMQNANNLRLATSNATVPSSWTTQFTTNSNGSTGIASVSGISTTGSAITFTGTELNAPPTISAFTPNARQVGGSVTISGSLFTGATAVSFNGTAQPTFTVVNDTTITTTVPTGATAGPVSVTNPFGIGTSASNFTVIPAPTVSGLSVTSGTFGTAVTITGTGFTWATQVQFNTTNAVFTVVNNTTITCTVPSGATTGVVTVTNPAGNASSTATFTVFPVPTITTFTPTSGPVGTSVTITGTEFNAITNVRFSGVNASFTVNSTTSITATVPSGAVTGTITILNGSGTATSSSNFAVTTPPSINGFSPTAGGTGTTVTISGSNFTGATAVTFNGVSATFTVVNATTITATVPATANTGLIAVTTPSGTSTSSSTFTVYLDLTVSTNTGVTGTYNNITVTSTGTANLVGSLLAIGNVTVQSGGVMNFGTEVLNGNGNFTANGGSRITTGSVNGISATGGISGSIQMNGTRTYSGRVEYNGAVAQNTGNAIAGIDSLIINNTNGVTLSASRSLNWINLQSGVLALGNNSLTLNPGGNIVGMNASNWIRTNGSGTLRRTVSNNNTAVLFPVGSDGYSPVQVTLSLASTTDVIGARVFYGVLTSGTSGAPANTSMVNRTWVLDESVAGGSTATVNLEWADTMETGGFNRTNCGISWYRSAPGSWMAPATYGAATGSNPFSVTRTGLTTFSAFAVGDNLANATLPVQLTKLVANKAGEDVIVSWSTASEFNNSHFEVERSFNGADFEMAGKVDGFGFTNSESNYNFVDEKAALNPTAQVIYYRLKQVDFDGKHTFYGPVAVNINKLVANVNVSVYPNPFNQQVNVQVVSPESGAMQISITDLQGRAVYTGTHEVNKGLQVISLDGIDTLKDGVYFMNSNINGNVSRVKLVKAGN
jgi:hypothetical protein